LGMGFQNPYLKSMDRGIFFPPFFA